MLIKAKHLSTALRKNDGLGTSPQVSDISPRTALVHRLPFTGDCLPPPAQDSSTVDDTTDSTPWPRKLSTDIATCI